MNKKFLSVKTYRSKLMKNAKAIDQINKLISDGSVITGVVKGANGITITLSNGNSYEITNGSNGTNAAVWSIGEDGYWYKDDVKQAYKAVGEKKVVMVATISLMKQLGTLTSTMLMVP